MPNSFTVFPNVLPGNVTIGGNLTVSGDVVRIGAAAPFTRIGKDNNGAAMFSTNLDNTLGVKDSAGVASFVESLQAAGANIRQIIMNGLGTTYQPAVPSVLFTDYTTHANHTGTTTEDTIYSKTIRAGAIGASGALLVRVLIATGSQGAPNTTLRIKLGANFSLNVAFNTGGDNFLFEAVIANQNAIAVQAGFINTTDFAAKTRGGATAAGTTDTSADQTLSVTLQNGTNTDVQTPQFISVELVNSYGPV